MVYTGVYSNDTPIEKGLWAIKIYITFVLDFCKHEWLKIVNMMIKCNTTNEYAVRN